MRRSAVPLATISLAAALALSGCGDDQAPRASEDPDTPSSSSSSTAESPSSDPTADVPPTSAGSTSSAEASDEVTVPVYLVGSTPVGDRLFREFREVPAADPLSEALALSTGGDALDPEYRSLFPAGEPATVSLTDDVIEVRLADETWYPQGSLSRAQTRLAAQQLVYTVQGAAGRRLPVRVVGPDGKPLSLFGLETTDYSAEPADEVLSPINITAPEQGAAVDGTVRAEGVANSFEANVPWKILDADGTSVLSGFATAEGYGEKLYPWATEIDVSKLAPGAYVFVATTDDPSDGEGSGPAMDSKDFTIG